jgi:esterase/lipase
LSKYHGEKTETLFEAWTETWTHDSFRRWNIENILSGIIDPLLVIQGKEDEYGSEDQVIGIIKNSGSKIKKSVMIEACGHIPHFQAKEIVLKEMIEFIQKNKN